MYPSTVSSFAATCLTPPKLLHTWSFVTVCCLRWAWVTGSATSAHVEPGASISTHSAWRAPVSLRTSSM